MSRFDVCIQFHNIMEKYLKIFDLFFVCVYTNLIVLYTTDERIVSLENLVLWEYTVFQSSFIVLLVMVLSAD